MDAYPTTASLSSEIYGLFHPSSKRAKKYTLRIMERKSGYLMVDVLVNLSLRFTLKGVPLRMTVL